MPDLDDEQVVEDKEAGIKYKIRRWRLKDDPHAYFEEGLLHITVFLDDLRKTKLTEQENSWCEKQAKSRKRSLESVLNLYQLIRAGKRKFQELHETGNLPSVPEQSSEQPTTSSAVLPTSSTEETVKPEPQPVNLEETEQIPNPPNLEESDPFEEAAADLGGANWEDTAELNREEVIGGEVMAVPAPIKGQLNSLKAEVEVLKAPLTAHTNRTSLMRLADAQINLARANQLFAEYDQLRAKIWTIDSTVVDVTALHTDMSNLRASLTQVAAGHQDVINTLSAPTPQPSVAAPAAAAVSRPWDLPKHKLPKFSGDWKEWLSFKDQFKTMVYDLPEAQLPAVKKHMYLREALEGEALSTIKSVPVTGADLERAWKAVCNKYDNTDKLRDDYIAEMRKLKPMTEPSAQQLRKLYEHINGTRESLPRLGKAIDYYDEILIYEIKGCFDSSTRQFYENYALMKKEESSGSSRITWEQMTSFVNTRCLALENCKEKSKESKESKEHNPRKSTSSYSTQLTKERPKCSVCPKRHYLYECSTFADFPLKKKRELVNKKRLCYNCLAPNHGVKNCDSKHTCKHCREQHHSLLHYEKGPKEEEGEQNTSGNVESSKTDVKSNYSYRDASVLLPTAIVAIKDATGREQRFRALLDTGSQATFISESAAQALGLKRRAASCNLKGIGNSPAGKTKGEMDLVIKSSQKKDYEAKATAFILPVVTGRQPDSPVNAEQWNHLKDLPLADERYHRPGKVDVLLGAEIAMQAFLGKQMPGPPGSPTAHATVFGWVVAGSTVDDSRALSVHTMTITAEPTISDLLQRHWKIEEIPQKPLFTKEEKRCEDLFETTTIQDQEGRFIVRIPFRAERPVLGPSREIAMRRLIANENRIIRDKSLHQQYVDFIDDYHGQGHMEEVQQMEKYGAAYLPHHAIIRPGAQTTKLRVVFDASCKTGNGRSFNDEQLVGPVIQDDLTSIIMRFRLYKYAINGDISQMYRQIWVHEDDRKYQRILWRESPGEEVKTFELKTVTYGTASAPYLATKCLQFLANLNHRRFPEAAQIIKSSFYMDDLLTGADSPEEAIKIQNEVTAVLKSAGFTLRKFASNDPMILQGLEDQQKQTEFLTNPENVIKTLGIQWNRERDCFSFMVKLKDGQQLTKRTMLSEIARIFDPLGWSAPVTVRAKMFLQG